MFWEVLSATSWGDGPLKYPWVRESAAGRGRLGHPLGVQEEVGPPVDVASSLHDEWDEVGLVGIPLVLWSTCTSYKVMSQLSDWYVHVYVYVCTGR